MNSKEHPTFSVVIPAYQAAATIGDAVASVLDQEYADWEIVVVDDGSTDGTAETARAAAHSDPRVRVFSQENAGPAAARNAGSARASGRYVCRLDADDVYLPGYLAAYASQISDHPDYDIFCSNGFVQTADGERRLMLLGGEFETAREITLAEMLRSNKVFTTNVYRRRVTGLAGGSRDGFYVEDYDLWIRAMVRGARVWFFPDVLAVYRQSSEQMSADRITMAEGSRRVVLSALESGLLDGECARIAEESLAYWTAAVERANLESRLRAGELAGARGRYVRALKAYRRPLRRYAGLLLMLLSPRLFARLGATSAFDGSK